MKLIEKQKVFCQLIAILILDIIALGYEVKFGHALRSIEEAERLGKKNSLHTISLAIDLLIFKDGNYLKKTEEYESIGRLWEGMSSTEWKCRWGGRFGDGNHFSIEHNGVK